jgi:hypothetical protein
MKNADLARVRACPQEVSLGSLDLIAIVRPMSDEQSFSFRPETKTLQYRAPAGPSGLADS